MKKYNFDPATRQAMGATRGAAGGVGASRSALTAGNLAKTQADATNSALANYWGSAASQAAQQRSMQQAAAYGIGGLGTQDVNAQLAGLTGQLGAGNNQYGYQQAPNQAAYNQQLLQFQTPFQLAGSYAGLAPAYGGTQTGQQTNTYPQQSPFGQIAGLAGTALGAYFGMPGVGAAAGQGLAGLFGGSQPTMAPSPNGPNTYSPMYSARGGAIKKALGGALMDGLLGKAWGGSLGYGRGNPYQRNWQQPMPTPPMARDPGFGSTVGPQMSGVTSPGIGGQMSGVTSPGIGGQMSGVTSPMPTPPMAHDPGPQGIGPNIVSDPGQQLGPQIMSDPGQQSTLGPQMSGPNLPQPAPPMMHDPGPSLGPQIMQDPGKNPFAPSTVDGSGQTPTPPMTSMPGPTSAGTITGPPNNPYNPRNGWSQFAKGGYIQSFGEEDPGGAVQDPNDIDQLLLDEEGGVTQSPNFRVNKSFQEMGIPDKYDNPGGPAEDRLPPIITRGPTDVADTELPNTPGYTTNGGGGGGLRPPGPLSQDESPPGLPTPPSFGGAQTAAQGDTSTKLASNPWMALINAGARMMQGPKRDSRGLLEGTNPLGQLLATAGHGAEAGVKTLEDQRKEARTDAQAKFHNAMQLAQYTNLTAAQTAENKLKLQTPVSLGIDPDTGFDVKGLRDPNNPGTFIKINPSTGTIAKDKSGEPVTVNPDTLQDPNRPSAGRGTPSQEPAANASDSVVPLPQARMGMSSDALRRAAENYRRAGILPPNLRSASGRILMNAIMSDAAMLDAAEGVSPQQSLQKRQDFKTQQVALNRFLSGDRNKIITGLNVATDHAATLKQLAQAQANGDIPLFNSIARAWAKQNGKAEPTNFDIARRILGTEIVKSLGVAGAGTENERGEAANFFAGNASPAQVSGAIDNVISPMLGGQLRGQRLAWKVATGRDESEFNKLLYPGTLKFLDPQGKTTEIPATAPVQAVPDKQRQEALDWISKNPKDPRVPAIKKKLGIP
jgi:hypothetical protein